MTETSHEYRCPLGPVDKRLGDVHRAWHEAEAGYFDPERFRIAIQTSIQTLRTLTFILQSNKRLFANFDTWYESWQSKLRDDPLMRWMVDARNKIEKQGDLEAHSYVRAEILASYLAGGPMMEVRAELFQGAAELLSGLQTEALRNHVYKDGILRVQRRWVENTLPDYELLDAVAIAYEKISELVADAHREIGLGEPKTMRGEFDQSHGDHARGGKLPCMIGHGEARSLNIWLATGRPFEVKKEAFDIDMSTAERAAQRYGIDASQVFPNQVETAEATLDALFATARKMFEADGHHDTIAFLMHGHRPLSIMQIDLQEHGEKYLVMRMLADEVVRCGADGVIIIGEVWRAPFDPVNPYRRAADAVNRQELLSATLVTQAGEPVDLYALIARQDERVALEATETGLGQAQFAFAPIYTAWGRDIPKSWLSATTSEP